MNNITFDKVLASANKVSEMSERNLRTQLAYLYRIFFYYGWSDLIVTHLSVRIPGENALLVNPFGLGFNEVTPNNLVKIDFDGNILESPLGFGINNNGTTVHRTIYKAKQDINCILHTHSHNGVAVSNLNCGLLLLDQVGMMLYKKVGYHKFDTLFINDDTQYQLLTDMQDNNCMILKNHGLLTVSHNIQEAFWFHYYLEYACKIQVLTLSTGRDISQVDESIVKETAARYENWRTKNQNINAGDSALLFEAAKRAIGTPW